MLEMLLDSRRSRFQPAAPSCPYPLPGMRNGKNRFSAIFDQNYARPVCDTTPFQVCHTGREQPPRTHMPVLLCQSPVSSSSTVQLISCILSSTFRNSADKVSIFFLSLAVSITLTYFISLWLYLVSLPAAVLRTLRKVLTFKVRASFLAIILVIDSPSLTVCRLVRLILNTRFSSSPIACCSSASFLHLCYCLEAFLQPGDLLLQVRPYTQCFC